MKYRDLYPLTQLDAFRKFIEEFALSYTVNEEMIVINSACFTLEVYGVYVEDILYFEFYTGDKQYYSNADRLFSKIANPGELIKILKKYQLIHTTPVTTLIHPNNLNNILKAEAYFFTYLEAMALFIKDFLECQFNDYKDTFTPAMQ